MKMKNHHKRIAAAVSAAVLCLSMAAAMPANAVELHVPAAVQAQAGELKTRNSHIDLTNVSTYESEHFKFYWGNSGADSSRVTESFLAENAKHLEACWNVYMNELSMNPPTQSVNPSLRDGNEYKVNFYIHNTGLKTTDGAEVPTDWAYMGYDNQGYAFMFCCVDAMNNTPNPSWVLPHEFGHVVTAHQYGWNDNKYVQSWWEAIANWYREQFLYSEYYSQWANMTGVTDYFETYMKNLQFTPILGRDNYASWAFLQYLTENPDNLGNYGSAFVKTLMQEGKPDEYPYLEIERLGGADIKDTLGHYAKRLATLDFGQQAAYRARQDAMIAERPWSWNQIFTVLDEPEEGYYTVPTDRAPQQFGVNIIPLTVTDGTVKVSLAGLTDVQGADWRACIAVEGADGKTRYSDLFGNQETASIAVSAGEKAYLVVTATPDSAAWQQVGVPWAYYTGEFDENNYPFLGKTRYPYAVKIEGAEVQQHLDTSTLRGSAHPNGGGFVASSAKVDASVYVGPDAMVLGNATVRDNAVITGHAVVGENANVSGNAIIGDSACVTGRATVSENARILESAFICDTVSVSGNATVKGTAFLYAAGKMTGQAMPDGDYYDDSSRTVQAGSVYGWASPDSYVNARPYNDGQVAGLEFSSAGGNITPDTYTSTYGVSGGTWEAERTSANGVMTFDGSKSNVLYADSSYAALHDADYQTAVLLRDNDANAIFRFGNADKHISLVAIAGNLILAVKDGADSEVQRLTAENAYEPGKWFTVSVIFSGDTCKLVVNGQTAAEGAVTLDPVDVISSDAAYTIGGAGSIGMNGSMDFFRVNFKEVAEPEYYYTATEEITEAPTEEDTRSWYYGDMDKNDVIDVFDLALLKRTVVGGAEYKWADCDGDGTTGVGDIIALTKFLHQQEGSGQTGQAIAYRVQSSNSTATSIYTAVNGTATDADDEAHTLPYTKTEGLSDLIDSYFGNLIS